MALDNFEFEYYPEGEDLDETATNLRSYFARTDDAKWAEYDPEWSNDKVMDWEKNFRSDGLLFLICSEREILVDEYREVLELYIKWRADKGHPIQAGAAAGS